MRRRLAITPVRAVLVRSPQDIVLGLILLAIVGVALNSEPGSKWLATRLGWGMPATRVAARSALPPSVVVVDWPAVTSEATGDLQAYLSFDTGRHGGQEEQAAQWLHGILSQAGIESHLVPGPTGHPSVVARLLGHGDARPLILYSHLDVPPPDVGRWSLPPFGGVARNGYVYGAGALDPKGLSIVQLMTMLALKRANVPLQRDVILLAVGSEQSFPSPAEVLSSLPGELQPEYLLGAGGGVLELQPGQRAWMVSTSAKGYLSIRVGPARAALDGSTGPLGSASEQLVRAVQRLLAWQAPLAESRATAEFFRRLAQRNPFPVGDVLAQPWAWSHLIAPRLLQNPVAADRLRDTISLARLEPWPDDPLRPSAVLTVRTMPGRTRYQLLTELQAVARDPDLRFEVLDEIEGQESDWDTPLFTAIEHAARREDPTVSVLPSGGTSDGSRYLRQQGVICYGLLPFDLDSAELGRIGQADERLSQANLQLGMRRMLAIVLDLCAGQQVTVMDRS